MSPKSAGTLLRLGCLSINGQQRIDPVGTVCVTLPACASSYCLLSAIRKLLTLSQNFAGPCHR